MQKQQQSVMLRTIAASAVLSLLLNIIACADMPAGKQTGVGKFFGTILQVAAMNYTGPEQKLAQSLVTLFNGGEVNEEQALYDPSDPYGVDVDGMYASDNAGYGGDQQTAGYYPTGTPSLDAALIGVGADGLLQMLENGTTLYGPSAGYAGDRVGIAFAPAADAYVYIIAFDSTGWAQSLFPDPALGHRNPVPAGQEVLIPGDALYGLDNVTGVETIYVLASNAPRDDIASQMAPYFGKERPAGAESVYRSVERPIIISRGLTGLRPASGNTAGTATVASGENGAPVLNSFLAADGADELAITLWFNHE